MAAPTEMQGDSYAGSEEDGELLEMFRKWDHALMSHWSGWLEESRLCYGFVAGDEQWDPDDRAAMEKAGKIPVTFNRTAPTIDAVSGAEITGRQEVSYEPRQVGASAQNEVLNKGAEWIRDECDAEHEESEAARDCFICGVGWTETRMDYEIEPEGKIVIERRDPLDILADANSRKANFADAKYIRERKRYSQDDFDQEFPDAAGSSPDDPNRTPVVVDPEQRYKNGSGEDEGEDVVIVSRYQWYESEPRYLVKHPDTGQVHALQADEFAQLKKAVEEKTPGTKVSYVKGKGRRYREAIVGSGQILSLKDLEVGEFTLKAMTGKRDRNKGVWYGLVRPMMDPQRFANKFFSQILNILNSNAKGGIMAEESAFKDIRDAEEGWSDYAKITWLQEGALSGSNPKIKDKTPPAYPQGQDRLMQVSIDAIRDVTGVNQEMLGLADRQQPGILEHQRKQAAYGILAAFFDAFRRYRKDSGRLLLKFMQKFLPSDYLVRIIGEDGSPAYQAIGTALQDDAIKFNVIIDDAPTGPNEKAKTWDMVMQLMPMLMQADLGPDFYAAIIPYSPFPTALSAKITQMLIAMSKQPAPPSPMDQAKVAELTARAGGHQAQAAHHAAQANILAAEADTKPGAQVATARLDLAKTAEIEQRLAAQMAPAPDPLEIY